MEQVTIDKLESVNWDFANSARKTGLHGIHSYPAKFIQEIPSELIRLFHPGDQSAVLDPFCGSGTTLVEAVRSGLPAIGIDLHPLAALIAKVKTTPLDTEALRQAGMTAIEFAQSLVASGSVSVPDIPRLDHWFQPDVQIALAALRTYIEQIADADIADALRICFSSIIVRVSNQESDTRYAAIDKGVTVDNVWGSFAEAVRSTSAALDWGEPSLFSSKPQVRIVNADILSVQPESVGDNVGLVVTSPPYPNAYEYWLYHKYRMYWLGMDPIAVREREIGARPHFFKKNPHTEVDFERQMGGCFSLLSKVMKEGSHACFIVGRSIIRGREIDNAELLVRASAPHGFRCVGNVGRNIAASRKSFNPSHGTICKERVVVFVRE